MELNSKRCIFIWFSLKHETPFRETSVTGPVTDNERLHLALRKRSEQGSAAEDYS